MGAREFAVSETASIAACNALFPRGGVIGAAGVDGREGTPSPSRVSTFGDGGCGCFTGSAELVAGSFDVNANGLSLFSAATEAASKRSLENETVLSLRAVGITTDDSEIGGAAAALSAAAEGAGVTKAVGIGGGGVGGRGGSGGGDGGGG